MNLISFIEFNKYEFLHQLKTNSVITQSKFVHLIYSIHITTQLFTHIYNIYLLFTKRSGKTLKKSMDKIHLVIVFS